MFIKNKFIFFINNYSKIFKVTLILGILVILGSYIFFILNEEFALQVLKEMIMGLEAKGVNEKMSQFELFKSILINNSILTFLSIFIGVIPVLFLPLFSTLLTFFAFSSVMAVFYIKNINFLILIYGLGPHIFIEFLGFLIASTIGIKLSIIIFKKIFSKERKKILLKEQLKNSFNLYVFVVFPIILFGAIIETTVSTKLLEFAF